MRDKEITSQLRNWEKILETGPRKAALREGERGGGTTAVNMLLAI